MIDADCTKKLTPIFIIGVPRSGTTLLRVLLDSHSRIAAAPETPWLLGGYGEYSVREMAVYLRDHYLGPVKNLTGESEEVVLHGIRDMLQRIFAAYLESRQKEILVLKTPDDIRFLDFLLKLYPHSMYIHIFRDGRDVACSTVDKRGPLLGEKLIGYGEINYENAMRRWYHWEKKVRRAFNDNEKLSYTRISYEELVTHPEETMRKVCTDIGAAYEEGMLDYAKSDHEYPEWEAGSTDVKKKTRIDIASIGRWKTQIDRGALLKLEANYGDLLQTLGYELGTDAREQAEVHMCETSDARTEINTDDEDIVGSIGALRRILGQKDSMLKQRTEQLQENREQLTQTKEQLKQANEWLKERNARIEELKGTVTQKNDAIKQRDEMIALKSTQLDQKNSLIAQKHDLLKQKDEQLTSQADLVAQLRAKVKDHEEQFRQKCEELIEVDNKFKVKCVEVVSKDEALMKLIEEKSGELLRFEEEKKVLEEELRRRDERIAELLNSISWKITSPLRAVYGKLLRQKK